MKKQITYTISRTIDTIDLPNGLIAFQDSLYKDGVFMSETEGITTKEAVETTNGEKYIEQYQISIGSSYCQLGLYHPGIKEAVRTVVFGEKGSYDFFRSFLIKKPYTYLVEKGGLGDALPMYLSTTDHELYDDQFNIQPKAMLFNYHNYSHMHNGHYDLKKALSCLKERDDIEWIGDRYRRRKGEPSIKQIPYYNLTEHQQTCLEFIWYPTFEDFAKIEKGQTVSWKRYEDICRNIFGFSPLEK